MKNIIKINESIVGGKLPPTIETEVVFFEHCNLSCSFCYQDRNTKVGMSKKEIMDKADKVIENINSTTKKEHHLTLSGGELFSSELDDCFMDYYNEFINKIVTNCSDKEIKIVVLTNLVIGQKRNKIMEFLNTNKHLDISLSTSYDFSGRFQDLNQKLSFKSNLEYFKDYVSGVVITLTNTNIKKLLKNADTVFKNDIYGKFKVFFEMYNATTSPVKMLPTDKEMYEAYTFLAQYYPETYPIKNLLERNENSFACTGIYGYNVYTDGKIGKCSAFQTKDDENAVDKFEASFYKYINERSCLSCNWYSRCTMGCFRGNEFNGPPLMEDCFLKIFLNENVKYVPESHYQTN